MKKFITLVAAVAMTVTVNAESLTASFGSANAIEKDTPVPCAGFTVPADYNPGGTSKVNVYNKDKGLKVRVNKGADSNELMLSVNEGYIITDLTMGMVVNDGSSTFSLSGISVDGTALSDFTSVALPNTGNANGAAVVNLTGIKASDNIVFTYDFEGYEGKNKQVFIAGSVTYEEAPAAAVFEWEPFISQPMSSADVTQAWQLETMVINASAGLEPTDVKPVWIDEDGNEIFGSYSSFSDPSWGQYNYDFNFSEFKSNGEYTLKLPEGLLKNAEGELSAAKEYYYSVNIEQLAGAMFDDFEVLSITPDLSQPQAIWTDQVITINTNHNAAIGYTVMNIYDKSGEEGNNGVVFSNNYSTGRVLGDAAPITWEITGSYKFLEDHVYSAEITFYNGTNDWDEEGNQTPVVAKATYEFTGKVEGFKYSDITLVDIYPAPEAFTISEASDAVFTYTFSGPVNVYKVVTPKGQNGNEVYPSSCFKSNEDKTVWTIDLSENSYVKSIDSELTLQLYARDLDGNQVKGNYGEESSACYEFNWSCDIGGKSVVVVTPAKGESLDRLTEVVVKSENGETMTWSNVGQITVQTIGGRAQTIATLVYERPEGAQDDSATEFRFTKWVLEGEWSGEPIDLIAEGSYVINVSSGCFVFGEQFSAVNSRALESGFSITGAFETPGPGIDPAEQETFYFDRVEPSTDETLASLSNIQLWYPETVACEEFTVNVYNVADQSLVTTGKGLYSWDDWNLINIELMQPVTEDGTYEVVIPARVIYTEGYEEGVAGICNPEIKLEYIVGQGTGVNTVAGAFASDVYDLNGRLVLSNATSASVKSLPKGIYVAGGRKVVVK